MPMGLKNTPSIHQRQVTAALRQHLPRICHIYLDNIVIWSKMVEEHIRNVKTILQALKDACLYCNPKKSTLFCDKIHFLGHNISRQGIEADTSKMDKITGWPIPKNAMQVRSFLGLVRYVTAFLLNLATHTAVLTELTYKDCDKKFPPWTTRHQQAFDEIKQLVLSRDCLTTIDYSWMPASKSLSLQMLVTPNLELFCLSAKLGSLPNQPPLTQ